MEHRLRNGQHREEPSFKCDELLNDVNCYFKASSSTGAKIAEFS